MIISICISLHGIFVKRECILYPDLSVYLLLMVIFNMLKVITRAQLFKINDIVS